MPAWKNRTSVGWHKRSGDKKHDDIWADMVSQAQSRLREQDLVRQAEEAEELARAAGCQLVDDPDFPGDYTLTRNGEFVCLLIKRTDDPKGRYRLSFSPTSFDSSGKDLLFMSLTDALEHGIKPEGARE